MTLFENLGRVMSPGDRLKLECEGCGRMVALPRDQAFRTFGAGATPMEVRRKAKCAACGGRRINVWV